jgi:hypothetical protein
MEHLLLKATALVCCGAVSWLTFRFIEVPFRFGTWRDPIHSAALVVAIAAAGLFAQIAPRLTTASLSPYQQDMIGLLTRVSQQGSSKTFDDRPCFKALKSDTVALFLRNRCVELKYPDRKSIFLIGDSHSASLSLGLRPLAERYKLNYLQVSTGFCEPIMNSDSNSTCKDINDLVNKKVSEVKPDVLIIDEY